MRVYPVRWLFWAHGMALTPTLILIRPERNNDQPLIEHEKVHCQQMADLGTLRFWWRYLTSCAFRLRMEVQAYQVQLRMQPWNLDRFAEALATRYFLKITQPQARALLAGEAP